MIQRASHIREVTESWRIAIYYCPFYPGPRSRMLYNVLKAKIAKEMQTKNAMLNLSVFHIILLSTRFVYNNTPNAK